MRDKHIVIIGAGPGGLTAGMLLAHRGFKVSIFEKDNIVGGRNKSISIGPYKFDLGPTFLMMKYILDDIFSSVGKKLEDYVTTIRLDPMYRLSFSDFYIDITDDHEIMCERLNEKFPDSSNGFKKFLKVEKIRFDHIKRCFEKPYCSLLDMLGREFITSIPYLALGRSVNDVLTDYYRDEKLRFCFCFQSKYLGMSPWECPGAFAMIPYVEHEFGIYHVIGGLSEISSAMARVIKDFGGEIYSGCKVSKILCENSEVKGVVLDSGDKVKADVVVINADFGYAMSNLFEKGILKKYSRETLEKKKYSCSTFMLYLGLDKVYDEPHHNIFFANDYRKNAEEVTVKKVLSEDFSFYVRNASVTDPTIAPKGHSALYVLVPVPNNTSNIDWDKIKIEYRDRLVENIKKRTSMKDIDSHIREEFYITPLDWERMGIFKGATFNLAHNLSQMLYFRPHNRFEELENCYLVGGGTHPGSGLPTIYESGMISSSLIMRKLGG
ncbi:MAG: phytoene desaturase family protein [Candidatus Hydrogenedentes bacterium]|nr:phytoene desaturase family protein [Candidatus Hydrogenedentota bacterium]